MNSPFSCQQLYEVVKKHGAKYHTVFVDISHAPALYRELLQGDKNTVTTLTHLEVYVGPTGFHLQDAGSHRPDNSVKLAFLCGGDRAEESVRFI